jgi:2-dehydropantoate 2-reductase
MAYIVYGAGGIGGCIGAALHRAGQAVTLIARGAHLDAIRAHGLRFRTPSSEHVLRIAAHADPGAIAVAASDTVILAMKSQDTAAALARLAVTVPAGVAIACVQNGIDNERQALRWFEHVYGVEVSMPGTHLEPGVVEAEMEPVLGILDVGRYPHGADARCARIAADLTAAGFASTPRERIMDWKQRKLLRNLGNALQALLGNAPQSREIWRLVQAEAEAVYAAAGFQPVSAAEYAERAAVLRQQGDAGGTAQVRRQRGGRSSTWQSLARGTGSSECDFLNGEIVLLGRLLGVPTPVNALLARRVREQAHRGAPPASLAAEAEANHLLAQARALASEAARS